MILSTRTVSHYLYVPVLSIAFIVVICSLLWQDTTYTSCDRVHVFASTLPTSTKLPGWISHNVCLFHFTCSVSYLWKEPLKDLADLFRVRLRSRHFKRLLCTIARNQWVNGCSIFIHDLTVKTSLCGAVTARALAYCTEHNFKTSSRLVSNQELTRVKIYYVTNGDRVIRAAIAHERRTRKAVE